MQAIVVESPAINMSHLPILEDSSDTKNGADSTNNFIKSPFVFEERKNREFFENFELTEKVKCNLFREKYCIINVIYLLKKC